MSELPGIGNTIESTPLLVCLADAKYFAGGRIIRGASARDPLNTDNPEVLRCGMILGMISETKKMAPSVIGLLVTDTATNSKNVVVSTATGNEVERRCGVTGSIKIVGPVDADTGVVTVSADLAYDSIGAAANGKRTIVLSELAPAAYKDGSWICDIDGTHIPMCILNEPNGVKVINESNASIDVEGNRLLISGQLSSASIINFPAAALTTFRAWVKAYLRATGLGFMFDDDWGV